MPFTVHPVPFTVYRSPFTPFVSTPFVSTSATFPMPLLSTERLYTGRIVNLDLDTVRFPDGSTGRLEMLRHPGAAAVVPLVDPLDHPDPRVMLIRQFRHAADDFIWEVPAGRLDPGETPEQCAARELEEEIGMRAGHLARLTTIYTTPGFTDERIHLFVATALETGRQEREADEFMEIETLAWSTVLDMVRTGQIVDAKTLVSLMFVQCFMTHP
jgi:ADP-ribose pyrophosphatase